MALFPPLPSHLTAEVLRFLDLPRPRHDQQWLDLFAHHYGQRVPWESASRIARVATSPRAECPRLPHAFWRAALREGTGGTCFETNAAVAALLASLGFDGDLTVNDMEAQRACHTALVLHVHDERVLVDVGYPLHAAVPLAMETTTATSPWFTYVAHPAGQRRYRIENHPHPRPYVYDLLDIPVAPEAYLDALTTDYAPGGLFLDRVVIRKIVDGHVWRFAGHERPWHLQRFVGGRRLDSPLPDTPDAAAAHLARHFCIPATTIAVALREAE